MRKAKQENTEAVDRCLQHHLSNLMAERLSPGSMAIDIGSPQKWELIAF